MKGDSELIQIVDSALAEAQRRSGEWLACRLGCTPCCMGPFPITALDAVRLNEGLQELERRDGERASRVRMRARDSAARMARAFPKDTVAAVLSEDDALEDEPCPALDPDTGGCDLYAYRPITCRTFGPALRFGAKPESEAVGVCELCYSGATDEQIAACAVTVNLQGETELQAELERAVTGGETLVALALAGAS